MDKLRKALFNTVAVGSATAVLSLGVIMTTHAQDMQAQSHLLLAGDYGRPYHHLKRNKVNNEAKANPNYKLVRSSKATGRPYHHLINTRKVERTEFAAFEKAQPRQKKRNLLHRYGRPYNRP